MKRAGVRPEARARSVMRASSSAWKRMSLVAVRRSDISVSDGRFERPLYRQVPPNQAERSRRGAGTPVLLLLSSLQLGKACWPTRAGINGASSEQGSLSLW